MENIIWYAGASLMVYLLIRLLRTNSTSDKEIEEIISNEKYKVKGRLDVKNRPSKMDDF